MAKWSAKYALLKFKQKEFGEAAEVLSRNGISSDPANFDLYRGIALEVLGAAQHDRNEGAEAHLKEFLQVRERGKASGSRTGLALRRLDVQQPEMTLAATLHGGAGRSTG
jgi:hypothetical protein